MAHKMKSLVLALFAVIALGAVVVSAASAHKLTSEKASTDLTGTGAGFVTGIKSGAFEFKCNTFNLTALGVPNQVETITATPTFANCVAEPFGAAPVDVNGCTFVLHAQTTGSTTTTGAARTTAAMDLECPAGKSFEITAPGCTVKTAAQKGLHGITFDNEGAGTTRDVKVTFAVDSISYTTPGGFVCALGGLAAAGKDGFMTGSSTFKGYELSSPHGVANHVGITFD